MGCWHQPCLLGTHGMRQHRWSSTPASRGAQCLRWRCPRFAAAWQAAASDVAAPLPLASARVLAAHLPGSARRRCRPLLPRIRHPRRSQRLCERSRPAAACGCLCHQQRVWYGGSAGGAPRSIACLPACLLACVPRLPRAASKFTSLKADTQLSVLRWGPAAQGRSPASPSLLWVSGMAGGGQPHGPPFTWCVTAVSPMGSRQRVRPGW